ncbi:MAG: response regulator [Hydrogenophilales bacterium]|nr:response regulator [Hydrogenophilales bacterium]
MADEIQQTQTAEPGAAEEAPYTLLCVDDEANILSALKRLFRTQGYNILTAASGKEGLALLEREQVDLVISDMRMPEMNGAQFLEQARARWPDTVRLLLTGYAEMSATVDAINKGGIYRYISKPWEDTEMVVLVREALERLQLEREKRRLEALTQRQNEELKELNASLEEKVKARTAELSEANEKLKKGFITSVQVFSNLIELRGGAVAGHSRKVAELARNLARGLALPQAEVQDVFLAALLHDIGKIGLPDKILQKPFASLSAEGRAEVMKHPLMGQASLMALDQLKVPAKLIRSHHERFDGLGYPDRLAGEAIPLGARILAVANDFDAAQRGTLLNNRLNESDALLYIKDGRGKRYDPLVANAFLVLMGAAGADGAKVSEITSQAGLLAAQPGGMPRKTSQLTPGMMLMQDLYSHDGVMLLAKDHVLDAMVIEQIRAFEHAGGGGLFTVFVRIK